VFGRYHEICEPTTGVLVPFKTAYRLIFLCFGLLPQFTFSVGTANPEFFAKVRAYKSEGKTQKAYSLVDDALKMPTIDKNEFPLLLMEKGVLARDLGHADEAAEAFQSVLNTETDLKDYANYELQKIDIQKKQPDRQRENLDNILQLAPNSKMQNETNFEIAKLDIEQKKYKQARIPLLRLERKNRREEIYPQIIYQLSRVERGLANQYFFCKWARKLYSNYPEFNLISDWGLKLSENVFDGQPTKCEASFADKKKRIKNLQWAGLSKKALQEIQLFKADDSSKPEAEKLEISYYIHEGNAEKAIAMLKPRYANEKNDPEFLTLVATAAARLGDSQAAIGSYYDAYKKSPRGKLAKQSLYQAAFMSYQFEDYDGAARKFQEFMKVYAGSGLARDAKWQLAWIRYLRGDFEESYEALVSLKKEASRSRRLSRTFAFDRVNFWIAMSLYRLGKYVEAREIFEPIANDPLYSFYSIAAKARIKKINDMYPQISNRILLDEHMRLGRYQGRTALVPSDDPAWFEEVLKQQYEEKVPETNIDKEVNSGAGDTNGSVDSEQEVLSTTENRDTSDDSQETAESVSTPEEVTSNFSNPALIRRFERARELMALGMQDWARWELFDIERKTSNREHLRTLMQEYEVIESYNRSSYIGHVTFGSQRAAYGIEMGRNLWEHAYPKAYSGFVNKFSREYNVPNELIWGIMRAESQYKKDIISPVGALGLMQVMPFTASKVADLLGYKKFDSKDLMQPENAIKIGAKYLQRLLKKFDGNIALVAAGYNAGPHRVFNWINNFGQLDLDEFIEHIPYLETRNYVKKVLSNFITYSKLYSGKNEDMLVLSQPISTVMGIKSDKTTFGKNFQKEIWEDL
jgi:soluble lytic murein transglycosylase